MKKGRPLTSRAFIAELKRLMAPEKVGTLHGMDVYVDPLAKSWRLVRRHR